MAITIRDIGILLGYDIDKQSEAKAENSIKSLKSMATKMLGAIGIGFSLTKIVALSEEFNGINDKINYAVKGLADQKEAQQAILKAANDSKTSYADMADIATKLVQSNAEMFPIDDAVRFSSNVTKLMKSAGKSDAEIKGIMDGLNKSFQKGITDTETINKLLEQSPESANILAKAIGVDRTQLLRMATDGKISVQQLKEAFIGASAEIDVNFANLNFSISDAMLSVRNSWGYFLDDLNSTLGITQTIAKGIVKVSDVFLSGAQKIKNRLDWIAEKLGGTEKLLKLIGITIAATFGIMAIPKLLAFWDGLKKIDSTLLKSKLKIMAIIAVIVVLALLVEDFFAFMRGGDSLFGELLGKAGIDADELRESISELWQQVKGFLPIIKEFAKQIGGKLVDGVKLLLPFLLELGKQLLPIIISLIQKILPMLMRFISAILPVILDLISSLLPIAMQIAEAVLPVIFELVEAIVPVLVEIVEAILPVILDLISSLLPIIQPIIELISALVSATLPVLVLLLKSILPILEPILKILKPIADILSLIIEGLAKVIDWKVGNFGNLVNKIFGGGSDVEGTDNVGAYASGTDNSSDTFIAGEKGPELVTGQGGKKIFTALATGRIFQAMAMLGKAATVKPSTVTNSSSNRTVTQYNEFVNTFNGDHVGQKKSSEAMSKASDDAVGAMARALAFAR